MSTFALSKYYISECYVCYVCKYLHNSLGIIHAFCPNSWQWKSLEVFCRLQKERQEENIKHFSLLNWSASWEFPPVRNIVDPHFSKSLIIHDGKTKEITTVKEVGICDPNYHKIRRTFALIFSKNYQCFEKLYQTRGRVFHQISKHFEVGQKKSAAPRFFNPFLSVWISDKTLFLVFDILHEKWR